MQNSTALIIQQSALSPEIERDAYALHAKHLLQKKIQSMKIL